MLSDQGNATIAWILRVQITVALVAAIFGGLLTDLDGAKSVILGGLTAFLPNAYFAVRFAGQTEGKTAKQVLNRFYAGEAVKLALTAVLFFCVLQIPNVKLIPLMVGFIVALSVFWFALLKK